MTREELLKRVSALSPGTVIDSSVVSGLFCDDSVYNFRPDCLENYIKFRSNVSEICSQNVYIDIDDIRNPRSVSEFELCGLMRAHYYIRRAERVDFSAGCMEELFSEIDGYIKEHGFLHTYILSIFELCGKFSVYIFGLTEKDIMVDMVEARKHKDEWDVDEFLKMV